MEDLIAYSLIAAFIAVPIWVGIIMYRKQKQKVRTQPTTLDEQQRERILSRSRKLNLAEPTPRKTESMRTYTSTANQPQTSSGSDLLSDLATLYVLNAALNHGSGSAEVNYDTGTIKTDRNESGFWGLDDADSRKSASDTFSSSDSSSSSDSGPSSDW